MPDVSTPPQGYGRLGGAVPVLHPPAAEDRARALRDTLELGSRALAEMLDEEPPALRAMLVADEDWEGAPRESARPYPPGLPYFTRSTQPPTLVMPEDLAPVIRPRTRATYPLTIWHELAHAFVLRRWMVRAPAWLRELVPQTLSAAVARRAGVPLDEHLSLVDREPGFTVRSLRGHADADAQMGLQNLLLRLGAAALDEFGERYPYRLVRALREQTDVVDERRAEGLLADALGPGGREWLASRPEF